MLQKHEGAIKPTKECFNAEQRLVDLMNDLYEIDKQVNAMKITKEQAKKAIQALENEKNVRTRKTRVLDGDIFPAFANLTVFLEYMYKSPYIQRKFEKDLKALFLSTTTKVDENGKRNVDWIFERFIDAATMTTRIGKNEDNIPLSEYRLILCEIMQRAVYSGMLAIGPHHFYHQRSAKRILMDDMDRALFWTQEIAHEARTNLSSQVEKDKKNKRKDKRPALF